jgi:hypothetical protein
VPSYVASLISLKAFQTKKEPKTTLSSQACVGSLVSHALHYTAATDPLPKNAMWCSEWSSLQEIMRLSIGCGARIVLKQTKL